MKLLTVMGSACALAMMACMTEPTASTATAAIVEWPPVNCPEGCGDNAASVGDGLVFHSADASGVERNGVGLRVAGMVALGLEWQLTIEGDEVVGVRKDGVLRGDRLAGAEILLERDGVIYAIVIAGVGRTPFWVGGGETWTYRLEHASIAVPDKRQPLCTTLDEALVNDPGWSGVRATDALVFRGDQYDATAKTVRAQPGAWFNIACAGSAMAKLHLLRHTEAGSNADHQTTWDERQAAFKMITDDLCGTGRPFTRDGERIFYMDSRQWHPFELDKARAVEAIWSAAGAVCLDEPRRLAEEGPALLALIQDECAGAGRVLPPCTDVARWQDQGYAITANP